MGKFHVSKPFAILLAAAVLFSPVPMTASAAEAPASSTEESVSEAPASSTEESVSEAPVSSSAGTESEAPASSSTGTESEVSASSNTGAESEAPASSNTGTESETSTSSNTGAASEAQTASESGLSSKAQSALAVTVKVTEADGKSVPSNGYSYNVGDPATTLKAVAECKDDKGNPVTGGTWSYGWINDIGGGCGCWVSQTADFKPPTKQAGTKKYYCIVTYTLDGKEYEPKESDELLDEVSVTVFAASAEKPTISGQPADGEYCVDAEHILPLSVKASVNDGGKLTYQWYVSRDGTNFIKTGGGYLDENKREHYLPALSSKAAVFHYYCVVTNTQPIRTGGIYTAAVKSDTATVTFKGVEDGTWKGEGTESSPFLLSSADDLKKLAELVNTEGMSFDGSYFKFTENITLPSDWAPIGALKNGEKNSWTGKNILPFSGTIDGGDHTLTVPKGGKPLLGYVRYAAVKNLNIYGAEINGYGLVDDYCVDYGPTGSYGDWTAGAAYPDMPMTITIDNVTLKSGTRTLQSGFIGGYASGANTVSITNSTIEDGVTIGYDKTQSNIGSFAGYFNGTMENCVSSAKVQGVNSVGGLVGAKGQSMGNCSIWDSAFHGTVEASGSYAGGLIGSGYNANSAPNTPCVTIQNCYSDGSIAGSDYIGGLLGGEPSCKQCWANGIGYIQNNCFSGRVVVPAAVAAENFLNTRSNYKKIFGAFAAGASSAADTASQSTAHIGGIIGGMRSLDRYNVISNNYYLQTNTSGAKTGMVVDAVEKAPSSKDSTVSQSLALSAGNSPSRVTLLGWGNSSSERYGRLDDPAGADAGQLARAATKKQFTDGSVLSKLNLGVNSSRIWVRGSNCYPALAPKKKHMVTYTVTGVDPKCYEGGDSLGEVSSTAVYNNNAEDPFQSVEIKQSDVRFSGFDSNTEGYKTVTAKYENHASPFEVRVYSGAETPSAGKITVSFRLIGATKSNGPVDLKNSDYKGSNYVTWIPTDSYTLPQNSTVYDLLQKALGKAGLKSVGTDYISTVYAPEAGGGYKLSASMNGPNSGWMYALNGTHKKAADVQGQKLEDGDSVVFHYVDDYSYEVEDWFSDPKHPRRGDGTFWSEWLDAPDEELGTSDNPNGPKDNPGSHGSIPGREDSKSDTKSPAAVKPAAGAVTFRSDTTSDFSVSGTYLFKITSRDGKAPKFSVGTPGVFDVKLVKKSGNDYFFRISAIGPAGAKAGIYVNGSKLLVATVGGPRTFVSDTTSDFSVSGTYLFKITSRNGKAPKFTVGTPGVFSAQLVKKSGSDYFFRLSAVGSAGAKAGIYVNGRKLLVATAGKRSSFAQSDTLGRFRVRAGGSYLFKVTADTKPTFAAGTASAFRVKFVRASGKNYFFRVTAVGKAGTASGFYINRELSPTAIGTVAA